MYLGCAHLGWVAFIMEKDEMRHPIQVGFFGAERIMFKPQDILHLVEEFFCHFNFCVD